MDIKEQVRIICLKMANKNEEMKKLEVFNKENNKKISYKQWEKHLFSADADVIIKYSSKYNLNPLVFAREWIEFSDKKMLELYSEVI